MRTKLGRFLGAALLTAIIAWGHAANAAVAVTDLGTPVTGSSGATIAFPVPAGGVPSGALIVVYVTENDNAVGSVADTAGNTYTKITSLNNGTGPTVAAIYYSNNVTALVSGNSITYTRGTSGKLVVFGAFYATGIASASPVDTVVTATNSGSSVTQTITSGAPSVSGDLMVGLYASKSGSTGWNFTQDSTHAAFSAPPDFSPTAVGKTFALCGGNVVYNSTSALTYTPVFENGGDPGAWVAIIVGFKAGSFGSFFLAPATIP